MSCHYIQQCFEGDINLCLTHTCIVYLHINWHGNICIMVKVYSLIHTWTNAFWLTDDGRLFPSLYLQLKRFPIFDIVFTWFHPLIIWSHSQWANNLHHLHLYHKPKISMVTFGNWIMFNKTLSCIHDINILYIISNIEELHKRLYLL